MGKIFYSWGNPPPSNTLSLGKIFCQLGKYLVPGKNVMSLVEYLHDALHVEVLLEKSLYDIKDEQQCSSTKNAAVKSKPQFNQRSNIDKSYSYSYQVRFKLTVHIF